MDRIVDSAREEEPGPDPDAAAAGERLDAARDTVVRGLSGQVLRRARQVVVFILGFSVVLIGLALIFLPGPALVVIPAGLAILGIEFAWARRWLARVRAMAEKAWGRARGHEVRGHGGEEGQAMREDVHDPEPRARTRPRTPDGLRAA